MIKTIDPVKMMLEIFEKRYPDVDCEFAFGLTVNGEAISDDEEDPCGYTLFRDGEIPLIVVSVALPYFATLEVIAHELAHVVCGSNEKHSDKWKETFFSIYDTWAETYETALKEVGFNCQMIRAAEMTEGIDFSEHDT
jgi:Zn-dependent peptidase ImmA (M78 family)